MSDVAWNIIGLGFIFFAVAAPLLIVLLLGIKGEGEA